MTNVYSPKKTAWKALRLGAWCFASAVLPLLPFAIPPGPWTPLVVAVTAFAVEAVPDYRKHRTKGTAK